MLKAFENRSAILAATLMIFTATVYAHTDGGIVVKNAWVREAPPVSPVMAAYMVIENHTGTAKELTSITSSAFQKVEIHQTVNKDGMTSMEAQNKLSIAAEEKIELKPGGTHLMLINPAKRLKAGDTVSFTFIFANGSKSIVSAPVRKASTMSSGHHHGEDNHENDRHHKEDNHHGGEHHKH